MGRAKIVEDDEILDAAERVVLRKGTKSLSIDTVAKEAGVSKSRVVYGGGKHSLLEMVVDRWLNSELEREAMFVANAAGTEHPELFGRISSAAVTLKDDKRAAALAIAISVSSEEGLQQKIRGHSENDLDAMARGPRPNAALMSYLALCGFYSMQTFGFYAWSDEEQSQILEGVESIYKSYPDS
ncbi:TetR/AcrR family transcriptional regulator [Rhizobium panacihumi]|uniref:TetR/AcrR family transcriptional regulator n=1 Tax=Rhizobium panacihumi TaxID=2008450 RepID=UPI003D79324A